MGESTAMNCVARFASIDLWNRWVGRRAFSRQETSVAGRRRHRPDTVGCVGLMTSVISEEPTLEGFLLVARLDILFSVSAMRFEAHDESMVAPRFLGEFLRRSGALGGRRQRECPVPSTRSAPNSPSNPSWSLEP